MAAAIKAIKKNADRRRKAVAKEEAARAREKVEEAEWQETTGTAPAPAPPVTPQRVEVDVPQPDDVGTTHGSGFFYFQPQARAMYEGNTCQVTVALIISANFLANVTEKEIDPQGLVKAIHDIASGKSILSPDIMAGVMRVVRSGGSNEDRSLGSLSGQERRVLALVAEGKTNKEIGLDLGLSDNTVKNYLVSVFEKLHVKRRSQAAALYVQAKSPGSSTSRPIQAKLNGVSVD